jgi:hypothetical protein
MRRLWLMTLLWCAVAGLPSARLRAGEVANRAVLVVLPFESPSEFGRDVCGMLRKKFARTEQYITIEDIDLDDIIGRHDFEAGYEDIDKAVDFARSKLGAHIVVWGSAEKDGDDFRIAARALDIRDDAEKPSADIKTEGTGRQDLSAFARDLVAAVRGDLGKPRTKFIPSEQPHVNLVTNGDFEQGHQSPAGWEPVNGLTTFWTDGGQKHDKAIRFDTDVYESEVKAWLKKFEAGAPAAKAPGKTKTSGPKYDTIGGTHGVHYKSDMIPVKPGMTYMLAFDMKGRWIDGPVVFVAKVFVKCYEQVEDEFGPQYREVARAYKACRTQTEGKQWEHFEREFTPTKNAEGVTHMRVDLYAYWPPDEYWFDNVSITEVGRTVVVDD